MSPLHWNDSTCQFSFKTKLMPNRITEVPLWTSKAQGKTLNADGDPVNQSFGAVSEIQTPIIGQK